MKQFEYKISAPYGLHARPAGEIVKISKGFSSAVKIQKDGKSADAKRLIAIMRLGVKNGDKVIVSAEGTDEETAIAKLEELFNANF